MQRSFPKLNRHRITPSQLGTSLIEVLVVLVILAVGILSIVRLFPAGFIALRNAENSTFADRLAQGALEALKKNNGALPDAIYMYSDTAGFDPTVNPDPNISDINSQRYVSNETITVPASRVVGSSAYPPLYAVNYGPIDLPDLTTHGDHLQVNGTPWTARTGDARTNPGDPNFVRSIDNPLDVLQTGQQTYLVDYGAGKIAVPQATYDQTFVLQVTRRVSGVQPPVYVTVPATTPLAGYNGSWFGTTTPTGTTALPASTAADPWSTVTLYRPFVFKGFTDQASGNSGFDSDPYEYQLFSSNIAGSTTNIGVLAFNRLASGQNGAQALKARISYIAQDWHILHEDHDVSAGTPTIRLTLNHLKKVGDIQFDQSLFNGLVPNATTPPNPPDIMLLDLDTGVTTLLNTSDVQNNDDNTGAPVGDGIYQVSYQNGRISFPENNADHSTRSDENLRIFYAGDADWAVAVQKAPSVYNRVDTGSLPNDTGTLKASGPTPNNFVLNPNGTRVYFPVCDEGKTVEFDGISYQSGTPAQTQQIAVGTAAISTDLDTTYGLPYVNLTGSGLNSSGIVLNTPTTGTLSFTAVRGVSARAVVIWRERNRWRVRATDTLLTQTQ